MSEIIGCPACDPFDAFVNSVSQFTGVVKRCGAHFTVVLAIAFLNTNKLSICFFSPFFKKGSAEKFTFYLKYFITHTDNSFLQGPF